MIFCFFAEDTGIFRSGRLFTATIEQMTARDSSNTHEVLSDIFRAMNTKIQDRQAANVRSWADCFPYVNGGLFAGSMDAPRFSRIARSYLLHVGTLDWTKINPDIFGSMTRCAEDILLAREAHFPATIAELYDPDTMPENLRAAHERNDETLERIYLGRRFKNDTERLEKLFELYTQMTAREAAPQKPAKRKKKGPDA